MTSFLPYLVDLYDPEAARGVNARLEEMVAAFRSGGANTRPLDERDALLITYGDQFRRAGEAPLKTLDAFARRYLEGVVSGLHILPFYPSTSDDGFSVVDYRQVDPDLGGWSDIQRLQERFLLMYDAVINHVSASSQEFQGFLRGDPAYQEHFICLPPDTDLSMVVRPRTLPLLTPFETARGKKWVWTTFSADQIDWNYHNPQVLLDIFSVLLDYAARGARFLRLDAIAYLWKEVGTSCIHLPQTHRAVQLLRAVLDRVAPHVLLISETNVPHADNISYFGDGTNEAQMVYNFALPPLVLHTFASGDAAVLSEWAASLRLPPGSATFFNFLASHDGIGVNPARGILSQRQVDGLLSRCMEYGGLLSFKTDPEGGQSAYEMNINYFDALSNPSGDEPEELQARRFLAAQSILLAMVGIPGIYAHSLLGSRGWMEGARQTGRNRAINRQKLDYEAVRSSLERPGREAAVYAGFRKMLQARASCPAFHPYGRQAVLDAEKSIFALLRTNPDGSSRALCLVNVTAEEQTARVSLVPGVRRGVWRDLLGGGEIDLGAGEALVRLAGYQAAWLELRP